MTLLGQENYEITCHNTTLSGDFNKELPVSVIRCDVATCYYDSYHIELYLKTSVIR